MSMEKRQSEAESQISEARKMPGYPTMDASKEIDNGTGVANSSVESHPGAPSKLPGYSGKK